MVRKQKSDSRDACHILDLLLRDKFPRIWIPSTEERDVRQSVRRTSVRCSVGSFCIFGCAGPDVWASPASQPETRGPFCSGLESSQKLGWASLWTSVPLQDVAHRSHEVSDAEDGLRRIVRIDVSLARFQVLPAAETVVDYDLWNIEAPCRVHHP